MNRFLCLGAGQMGAPWLAGLAARAPEDVEFVVCVPKNKANDSSRRIAECCEQELLLPFKSIRSQLSVQESDELNARPDFLATIDGIISVLPSVPDFSSGYAKDPPSHAEILKSYAEKIRPGAPIAAYSALGLSDRIFGDLGRNNPCVFFHFLTPGSLMRPIEVAATDSSGSAEAAYEIAGLFSSCDFEPLVFEQLAPGFASNRIHCCILDVLLKHFRGIPSDAEIDKIDQFLKRAARRLLRLQPQPGDTAESFDWLTEVSAANRKVELALAERLISHFNALVGLLESATYQRCWRDEALFKIYRFMIAGPALRWLQPGYFHFMDMMEIAKFYGVYMNLLEAAELGFSEPDSPFIFEMFAAGRHGFSSRHGFYKWGNAFKSDVDRRLRDFLRHIRPMLNSREILAEL